MSEPSPIFDVGPYATRQDALSQAEAILHGLPAEMTDQNTAAGFAGELLLMDALLRAGVVPAGWEDVARQMITERLPPEVIQVIAGWIMRAHLTHKP